jgi:hypothetical protein
MAPPSDLDQAIWLYSMVAPLAGDSFFIEYSQLDAICFKHFPETPNSGVKPTIA